MAPAEMQPNRKQSCSREGTSANYGEACKEGFYSLRSASVDVVCSHPSAPQLCFQTSIIIRLPPFFCMPVFYYIWRFSNLIIIIILTFLLRSGNLITVLKLSFLECLCISRFIRLNNRIFLLLI